MRTLSLYVVTMSTATSSAASSTTMETATSTAASPTPAATTGSSTSAPPAQVTDGGSADPRTAANMVLAGAGLLLAQLIL
ncbi:hypothetical protein BDY21DRAFT_39764 [Lineolata rhizophorae]|uniref:Uncharacterized protein n=1 Tax=Lineolata rhizophorae TaxID=578093 RepID=A0A6A6NY21_9PEZI|nr:hypothetical protein BDY21DRAFT_39764 [Lineolata rhizophorae]